MSWSVVFKNWSSFDGLLTGGGTVGNDGGSDGGSDGGVRKLEYGRKELRRK